MTNPTLDYRRTLLALLKKIERTRAYYRKQSELKHVAARGEEHPWKKTALSHHASSLGSCAGDMEFMLEKSLRHLAENDLEELRGAQES